MAEDLPCKSPGGVLFISVVTGSGDQWQAGWSLSQPCGPLLSRTPGVQGNLYRALPAASTAPQHHPRGTREAMLSTPLQRKYLTVPCANYIHRSLSTPNSKAVTAGKMGGIDQQGKVTKSPSTLTAPCQTTRQVLDCWAFTADIEESQVSVLTSPSYWVTLSFSLLEQSQPGFVDHFSLSLLEAQWIFGYRTEPS